MAKPPVDPAAVAADYEFARPVTPEQYHRLEAALPGRYEYHQGQMYRRFFPPGSHRAMAGGTEAHAQLILRLLVTLAGGLAGGPCRVYPSDMKLAAGGGTTTTLTRSASAGRRCSPTGG